MVVVPVDNVGSGVGAWTIVAGAMLKSERKILGKCKLGEAMDCGSTDLEATKFKLSKLQYM